MKNKIAICLLFLCTTFALHAQTDSLQVEEQSDTIKTKKQRVYVYKPAIDIPLTAGTAGLTLYNFSQIYSKERISEATLMSLDPEDVGAFDRSAAGNYDEKAEEISDYMFYGAIPLPLIAFAFDREISKDYHIVSLLYLEAMSLTGVTYSSSQQLNDRRRPWAYSEKAPLSTRTSGSTKNSFMAGHPALVATATFFLAKVYADYHPDSDFKWVLYAFAGASTYYNSYLRVEAGRHFPSDAIAGSIVGIASGILVPHFHKNKLFKDPNLSILPVSGEYHGLRLSYTF